MTENSEGRGFITALGALLALAVFLYTASHTDWILRETDLWWHIRTGQLTLQHWSVPQTDPFSYTYGGQPWIAKEWLSQVVFALSYDALNWAGPLLVTAVFVALTGWLIYVHATKHIQPIFAAVLVIAAIFLSQGVTVARPHMLTFPLVVAMAIITFDAARAKAAPPWWSLLLIILWTNLHGSFAIGIAIAACAFIDYFERARFTDLATLLKWVAYGVLSVLVTLINPYFIKPYLIAATLVGGVSVMDRISEWAPFTAPSNSVMEAGFMLLFLLLLKARAKFTFGQILFTLLAFHMALTHLRFLYVFFLAVPVVLLPDVAEALPSFSLSNWLARPRDGLERALGRGARAVVALTFIGAVATCAYFVMSHVVPPEKSAISGALAYIEKNKASDKALQTHVFNDFNFGGPLILAGIPTYIDDRAEQLYIGSFLEDYLKAGDSDGKDVLAKILSRPDIGWAIIPVNDPRETNLHFINGWKQVYADDVAAIWEKDEP